MATIIQNNIEFTNVQNSNIYAAGGKYSISMNDDGSGKFDTTLTGEEIAKSFNSIEIDWNGAELEEDVVINTTGEFCLKRCS